MPIAFISSRMEYVVVEIIGDGSLYLFTFFMAEKYVW